jgi:hypothetical protein
MQYTTGPTHALDFRPPLFDDLYLCLVYRVDVRLESSPPTSSVRFPVGHGGFRAVVVAQGQQPPSIRIGLAPSPIPYALHTLSGSREGSGPIFATAS